MSDDDALPDVGLLYVAERTCDCGAPLRFDPSRSGETVGGLHRFGWWSCMDASCGKGWLPSRETREKYRAEIAAAEQASAPWTLAKGGRSLDAGGVRVRAEGASDEVTALMVRLQRLPMLEALLVDPLIDVALGALTSDHADYDEGEEAAQVERLRARLREVRAQLQEAV